MAEVSPERRDLGLGWAITPDADATLVTPYTAMNAAATSLGQLTLGPVIDLLADTGRDSMLW